MMWRLRLLASPWQRAVRLHVRGAPVADWLTAVTTQSRATTQAPRLASFGSARSAFETSAAQPFTYDPPLVEGLLLARPNRFVGMVYAPHVARDVSFGTGRTHEGVVGLVPDAPPSMGMLREAAALPSSTWGDADSIADNPDVLRCHVPSTGIVGPIFFGVDQGYRPVPCLLAPTASTSAKTSHTVEAISLDDPATGPAERTWIGINQTRVNRVIEHFIATGQLGDVVGPASAFSASDGTRDDDARRGDGAVVPVQREKRLGSSRLDFFVPSPAGHRDPTEPGLSTSPSTSSSDSDDVVGHWLEVKMPLVSMPVEGHANQRVRSERERAGNIGGRLIRHYAELREELERRNGAGATNGGCPSSTGDAGAAAGAGVGVGSGAGADVAGATPIARASVLITFLYDAPRFDPPPPRDPDAGPHARRMAKLMTELHAAAEAGVQTYQVCARLTPTSVHLLRVQPLHLATRATGTIDNRA